MKVPSSAADTISNTTKQKDECIYIKINEYEATVSMEEAIAIAGRILATVEIAVRNGRK